MYFCFMSENHIIKQSKNFDLPIQKKRNGEYKIPSGGMVHSEIFIFANNSKHKL